MKPATEAADQTKISQQLSLYYIEEALIGLIEAREMAETDEDRAVCDEQMRLYVVAEVRKVDGILAMMRNCKALAVAAKTEAERLGKLERAWSRRLERLEQATLGAMQSFGESRLDGNLGAFCVRKNPPSVEIHNASLVPLEYQMATISMRADVWVRLCEFMQKNFASMSDQGIDETEITQAADEFFPRKDFIAKELKRQTDCVACKAFGSDTKHCSECGGTGQQSGHVAGARLVTDKVRLEVR